MKPARKVPVERVKRRQPVYRFKQYVMKNNEDLDDVLDRVFGEGAYAAAEPKDSPIEGWIVLPSGERRAVHL